MPAFPVAQWRVGIALAAYSCGGSHGLGPDWVVRTVFPINPLEFIRRGTIARAIYAPVPAHVNVTDGTKWREMDRSGG